MNNHTFDIAHFPETFTNVSEHFNSPGHSIQGFSFMPIDKVSNDLIRPMDRASDTMMAPT